MPKLSINQKNWILSAHISFAALWTGAVLSMFLLSLRNMNSTDAAVLHTLNAAITLLDDWIVIPSAISSVVTATVLCWVTNYGFVKFYWVITKWVLTTGLIMFGLSGYSRGAMLLLDYLDRKDYKLLATPSTGLMPKGCCSERSFRFSFLLSLLGSRF